MTGAQIASTTAAPGLAADLKAAIIAAATPARPAAVERMTIDAAWTGPAGAPGHEPRVARSSGSRVSPSPPPRCSRSSRSPSSSSMVASTRSRWGDAPSHAAGARRARATDPWPRADDCHPRRMGGPLHRLDRDDLGGSG